jgi:hypothetical protein
MSRNSSERAGKFSCLRTFLQRDRITTLTASLEKIAALRTYQIDLLYGAWFWWSDFSVSSGSQQTVFLRSQRVCRTWKNAITFVGNGNTVVEDHQDRLHLTTSLPLVTGIGCLGIASNVFRFLIRAHVLEARFARNLRSGARMNSCRKKRDCETGSESEPQGNVACVG